MNSGTKVFDALKSRYPILSRPPSDAGKLDDAGGYLTQLWVFGNRELDDDHDPQHSLLPDSFSKLMIDLNTIDPQTIQEKLISALSALSFRCQHVLVQFWSPATVRNRCLLTTWDQPFALGAVDDEGLYSYRLDSEQRTFVVDSEHREELGPPARVYNQKLPEWSFDIQTLPTRQSVQDLDASYNIYGYILLPVFEPDSEHCVGVLELVISSNYVDNAFEVEEVSRALKEENLKSPNVSADPTFNIKTSNEGRQNELAEISIVLKTVCDTHKLTLAQTWSLSECSSFVANSGKLEQMCSSFKKRCIGKICMSTGDLPFYIRDKSRWKFHVACTKRHLEKSRGVVGRSLLSCGTWYCKDVTELDEDDYPLVHVARKSGLTSCLAIYIKSRQLAAEYVIEFFLPTRSRNEADLQNLVKTVKQHIKNAFHLGIVSSIQEIGAVPSNWNIESRPSPITLLTGPEVPRMSENIKNEPSNSGAVGTSHNLATFSEKVIEYFDINPGTIQKNRKRNRSESSISLEDIKKQFGKSIEDAAAILNVSRSTLKRICRNFGIPGWPFRQDNDGPGGFVGTNDLYQETVKGNVLEDGLLLGSRAAVFRLKRIRTRLGTPNLPYGNGPDERLGTTNISTHDGLEKLEEVVAARSRLRLGSFKLKYEDKEGDIIWVACDSDLMELGGDFRQSDSTVIKLLVSPVVHQSPESNSKVLAKEGGKR
ncbi:NIN-like protein [Tanacetum coccineum]